MFNSPHKTPINQESAMTFQKVLDGCYVQYVNFRAIVGLVETLKTKKVSDILNSVFRKDCSFLCYALKQVSKM